jgi:hypothetical protein
MKTATILDHPLSELFPLMEEPELAALAADIQANGLRTPILLFDDQILDGRNRYRACQLAGVEPVTSEFAGEDPLQFVLSANLHRRHLNESQRALVAARITNLKGAGRPTKLIVPIGTITEKSQSKATAISAKTAAAMMAVGKRSVMRAKTILDSPTQAQAVAAGTKTVNAAAKEIKAREQAKEVRRDKTGYAIPEEVLPMWDRDPEVAEIQNAIARAVRLVKDASADTSATSKFWGAVNLQHIEITLYNAKRDLDGARPYAVCCTCQGRVRESCRSCKGRGYINKHLYDVCVPEELKAIRAKSCVLP